MTIFVMATAGVLLMALVVRLTGQAGYELGRQRRRPSVMSAAGFLLFPSLALGPFVLPERVLTLLPEALLSLLAGGSLAMLLLAPVLVPVLIGIPIGFLGGLTYGWSKRTKFE